MADDLAAADRGELIPGDGLFSSSLASAPRPAEKAGPTMPAPPAAPFGVPLDAARISTPHALPQTPPPIPPRRGRRGTLEVRLPSRPPPGTVGRRRFLRTLLGAVALVIVGGSALLVASRFPKRSGTVADAVPAEALAFVSVRMDAPFAETLLLLLVRAVDRSSVGAPPGGEAALNRSEELGNPGGLSVERLKGASDVTYLLLPGSSPAEPIPALLVRGIAAVDLSAAPSLSLTPLRTGVLIADSTHLGRVTALSGRTWGEEPSFRERSRVLPAAAPLTLAVRGETFAAFLQPFSPAPLAFTKPLVLSFDTAGDRRVWRVVGSLVSWNQGSSAETDPRRLFEKLPSSVVLAFSGGDAARLFSGQVSGTPGSVKVVLRALEAFPEAWRDLQAQLRGPWAVGVLATETAGVRDAVAVIPLAPGSDAKVPLRTLEPAFREFSPLLVGAAAPEATFAERDFSGVSIRFMNFGSPARAFDYAVVDDALLLATSKASILALVDAVQKRSSSLASSVPVAALADLAEKTASLYLRSDPALRSEVPEALSVFLDLFESLLVFPVTESRIEGLVRLRVDRPGVPFSSSSPAVPPQRQPEISP